MPAESAPLNRALDVLEDSGAARDPDEVYALYEEWATSSGRPLYPHQEEALLELVTGEHVILATPTGSGKSLVAVGAIFSALAQGRAAFYTAPIKALVSEKFFDLLDLFGSANVGMVTGDSAINPDAPIICCTAEILANQALRDGGPHSTAEWADAVVVMDEFHFYGDPQRGGAWQIPLLELPRAQFLLMSATLGDVSFFREDLERRTGTGVALIDDAERPVPLSYSWSLEPVQELLLELTSTHREPVYVVHFSQKDAVERAQSLTSVSVASRERRDRIAEAIGDFRFTKGFGQTLSRLLRQGVGVHHAGMLPRYRRLVERLTQQGLLGVVCGTDTLGVGINVPIRTVLITALTKFDGERMRHLSAREFHQIAGRAGRAGFDTTGEVIVQAPEHEIENARLVRKAGDDPKKLKRVVRKKAPSGSVNWTEKTYLRLRDSAPEPLTSQFHVTHAMALSVLAREGDPVATMYRLCTDNHEVLRSGTPSGGDRSGTRNPHLRRAVEIYRSLRAGGIVEHRDAAWRREHPGQPYLRLTVDLPRDFALNAPLSPFALAAMELLDPESPDFAVEVVSVVEAVQEDPRPVLYAQERAARGDAIGAMKAEGVEYEERMELADQITWPRPLEEMLEGALSTYRQTNPWVADYELKPKTVVREMVEQAMTFSDLISRYQLARAEGVVLRYLTDTYRAMRQLVPDRLRTEEVEAIITWLGDLVRAVDSSLLDEWEQLAAGRIPGDPATEDDTPSAERRFGEDEHGRLPLTRNRHAFRVLVRNALFRYVDALARESFDTLERLAAGHARPAKAPEAGADAGEPGLGGSVSADLSPSGARSAGSPWAAQRWEQSMAPYWREYEWLGADGAARSAALVEFIELPEPADLPSAVQLAESDAGLATELLEQREAGRVWLVRQTFADPEGDHDWGLTALVDLDMSDAAERVVLHILTLGPR